MSPDVRTGRSGLLIVRRIQGDSKEMLQDTEKAVKAANISIHERDLSGAVTAMIGLPVPPEALRKFLLSVLDRGQGEIKFDKGGMTGVSTKNESLGEYYGQPESQSPREPKR
jgi:hypothetical protein